MVRFKNRYLLVKLIPLKETQDKAFPQPNKKARLTDMVKADENLGLEVDEIFDPSYFAGLNSSLAASYIRQSLEANFGVHASAINSQSLSVKYCNTQTGMVLVRSARDSLPQVWASLTFLTGLPGEVARTPINEHVKYAWRVVHVSGTMKKIQTVAIKLARKEIAKLCSRSPDRKTEHDDILLKAEKTIKQLEA